MQAIIETIPPCSWMDSMCYVFPHFGEMTVTLIDCGTNETLGTIEQAIHDIPPCSTDPCFSGQTFPPAGVDILIGTTGDIIIDLITPPVTDTLTVCGAPMSIMRSDPDPITRHIDTEIVALELCGESPTLGRVRVQVGSVFGLPPSIGGIDPLGGSDFPADAFFNISFKIIPDSTAICPTCQATVGVEERKEEPLKRNLFILHQAAPNPLTTLATIRFGLSESGWVSLKVYNLRGERVRTLIEDYRTAGLHKEVWDLKDEEGKEVSSGVYFYRLTALGGSETRKMILLR
jgi:hypothetical protein